MNREELVSIIKDKDISLKKYLTNANLEGIKSNFIHYDKNEMIYSNGDPSVSFYFISKGEVLEGDELISENNHFGLNELRERTSRKHNAITGKKSIIIEFIVFEDSGSRQRNSNGHSKFQPKLSTIAKQIPDIDKISLSRDYSKHFDSIKHKDIVIVYVNVDKATLAVSKKFLEYLNKIIADGEKKIIIDLYACSLIDSTFMGTLVKSLKNISHEGGELILVYNKDNPSTLFMITYMDKVFKTFDKIEKAIGYFVLPNLLKKSEKKED